jgi:hypothetical protein
MCRGLRVTEIPNNQDPTDFWCAILIDEDKLGFRTEDLIVRLFECGAEMRHRWQAPLYRQSILNGGLPKILRLSAGDNLADYHKLYLPSDERVAARVIGLPNQSDMRDAEMEYVIGVIRSSIDPRGGGQ